MRAREPVISAQEVGDLYLQLSRRLEDAVRSDVRASDALIEDACQFAWYRLLHRRHDVERDSVLAWLATVAVHEAFKLIRREQRVLPLEAVSGPALTCGSTGPHELAEQHEQLAAIGSLPTRQQRLMWLKGLGLSYVEMARETSCTTRTVERQLLRARTRMRGAQARAAA